MQTWPFYGVPQNPVAWLTQTAKRVALDLVRRENNLRGKQEAIIAHLEAGCGGDNSDGLDSEAEIQDDQLRLLFACCHPRVCWRRRKASWRSRPSVA